MNKNTRDNFGYLSDDDIISRYLQGETTDGEEAVFMNDLKIDQELRENAITQARIIKGMKSADEELIAAFKSADKSVIESVLEDNRNDATSKHRYNMLSFSKWISMAAAVLLILFCGYKGYDYYDTTRLGMEYANSFPLTSVVRGDSDSDVETELQGLFDNVIQCKDLDKTTARLEELWLIVQDDTFNVYTDYAPYIGWYLAIGYLENYEKTKAKDILNYLMKQNFENKIFNEKVHILFQQI